MSTNEVQDRSRYYYLSGKRIELTEDPNVFAVGFQPGKRAENAALSPPSRRVLEDSDELAFIAQYNLRIYKSSRSNFADADLLVSSIARLDNEEQVSFAAMAVRRGGNEFNLSFVTRRFVVSFKKAATDQQIEALYKETGARVLESLKYVDRGYLMEAERATGPRGTVSTANIYYESGLCEFAHADFIERRQWKESDSTSVASRDDALTVERDGEFITRQWHLNTAKVTDAWAISAGSSSITIAVLDDGIDVAHAEFTGRIRAQFDFQSNVADGSPKASDDNHGTACAGVATAAGVKASGVAPRCSMIAVRTPSFLGVADEANMFRWTADQGADVISCSWGPADNAGPFALVDNVRAAINYCVTRGRSGLGIPIFFAAGNGNESVSDDGYASNPDVMAIAASSERGLRSPYSDFGPEIFISAPSSGDSAAGDRRIFTTDRLGAAGYNAGDVTRGDALGSYTSRFGGTSSACPLVAGVAALVLSVDNSLTRNQVREILKSTADKIGGVAYDSNGHSNEFGFGRVNALAAVQRAQSGRSGGSGGASSITVPATATAATPPTFNISLGARRLYAVELASRRELLDSANAAQRTVANYFETWSGGLRSTPSFTPAADIWAGLASSGQVFYLAHFADDNAWANYAVSSPVSSAPSVSISSGGSAAGGGPSVTGPATARASDPPVFQVNKGNRQMFALEFATEVSLFESANSANRTSANHYGAWAEGLATGNSYTPPANIWSALASAARVFYRGHFADDATWGNYTLAPVGSPPSVSIEGSGSPIPDATPVPTELKYPSGAVFASVTSPADGIDYEDSVGNGVIPLIDVRGRGEEKLSANFQVKELAAAQVRYARIAPKLVEVLQAIRTKLGQAIKVESGYRHPALNLALGDDDQNEQISGRAARVKGVSASLKPIDIARAALESTGENLGLGLGPRNLHIEVTGRAKIWVSEGAPMTAEQFATFANNIRNQRAERVDDDEPDQSRPTIEGPSRLDRAGSPPSFHIVSKNNRCFAVEVAIDPRLLDVRNSTQRSPENFYGAWGDPLVGLRQVGTESQAVFELPLYAWKQLRRAQSLYFRVLTTADLSKKWSNYMPSLTDQMCFDAPRIKIVDQVVEHTDPTSMSLQKLLGSHEQDANSWNR